MIEVKKNYNDGYFCYRCCICRYEATVKILFPNSTIHLCEKCINELTKKLNKFTGNNNNNNVATINESHDDWCRRIGI